MTRVPSDVSIQKEGDLLGTSSWARPQGGWGELPTGAFHFGCWNVARLASLPTKYIMLVGRNSEPFQGWRTCRHLPAKFGPPSQFLRWGAGPSWDKITLCPLPRCLNWKCFPHGWIIIPGWVTATFSPVTYARGLQYWVEKLNLPESPEFHPLVGTIVELRETVREHVVFTNWDLLWDLGRVNLGAMKQWPQPSLSSRVVLPLGDEPSELDTGFTEATTQTVSPAANDVEPIRHITPQDGMGKRAITCWSSQPW